MKRLLAFSLSLVISGIVWFSPLLEEFTSWISISPVTHDSREMNYAQYHDRPVTGETYREVISRTPNNVVNLYYMGSSDVIYGELGNPGKFIPKYLPGFDMYMSGRPYAQSLYHTIELAAVAPHLRNRKVVYNISPQHFTSDSPGPKAFQSVFSWLLWMEMLDNPDLSDETKTKILKRSVELFPGLCHKYQYCDSPSFTDTLASVSSPGNTVSRYLVTLSQLHKELLFKNSYSAPYSGQNISPKPVPNQFWTDRVNEFQLLSKAQSNNPMTVPDRNWLGNVKDKLREHQGKQRNQSYAISKEYQDLTLFLDVAKELNIEVLIAMTPPSAKWLKHTAMPRLGVETYYRNIRELVDKYEQAKLADFSALENEDYYFEDQSHLWMTAWTRLIEASYKFALAKP